MRQKKEKYAIITPKTEKGKHKISYHGDRWVFRKIVQQLMFYREPGPYIQVISRDGKALLLIKQNNDPDFDIRML